MLHSLTQSFIRQRDVSHIDWNHYPILLEDGSRVCLQYYGSTKPHIVLLLFPSLTGAAEQFWRFKDLIEEKELKDKSIVLVSVNKRGTHCPLTTRKWDMFGNIQETQVLIDTARNLFPSAKRAYAIGYSAGGLAIAKYLESPKASRWIRKAAIISSPLNSEMFDLCPYLIYLHLRYRVLSLYFLPYLNLWNQKGECVVKRLLSSSIDELAEWASNDGKNWKQPVNIHKIKIPLYILQAKDDIMWGWKEEWRNACTPRRGVFELKNQGGHLGFYQMGWAPESYMEGEILRWLFPRSFKKKDDQRKKEK